jgi:hypothetical protein
MARDDKPPHGTDGTDLIVTGVSVGAIGVAGAVLLGATCPVCVVATPALIGAGLYKKWRAKQGAITPDSAASPDPREEPRR